MKYTDLIFDLYGTLVDIHTEENDEVWEKTALFFGYYGARYTAAALKKAFRAALSRREAQEGQCYECFPDIPFEEVMAELFLAVGVEENADALGIQAAQLFRILSTDYIRLYPAVIPVLQELRRQGVRLWLLSNAQRVFTAFELEHLGLTSCFEGIYLSSDYRCRKPDPRFLGALLREQNLDIRRCLMIGNDRQTDIAGAKALGMDTLYLRTNLTPPDQLPADSHQEVEGHYEIEGCDWKEISRFLSVL